MNQGNEAMGSLLSDPTLRQALSQEELRLKVGLRSLSDDEAAQMLKLIDFSNLMATRSLGKASLSEPQADFSKGLGLCGSLPDSGVSPVSQGGFVELSIEVPWISRSLHCVGVVLWAVVERQAKCFRAGVSFLGVLRDDLKSLEQ